MGGEPLTEALADNCLTVNKKRKDAPLKIGGAPSFIYLCDSELGAKANLACRPLEQTASAVC